MSEDALAAWNLVSLRELAEPLPPVPWVCESLGLAPGAVALVAGYGYSGKTMAMQSLGLSIASGKPVWCVYGVRQGAFVHLDYEQGRRLTQERYQRLAYGMGLELKDLPNGSLCVAAMPRVYLDREETVEQLTRIVDGAAMVLVDSLRAAFPSADENSSEVRTYLDALSRVSERTGACIVVIHHARKPSATAAGTATHTIRGSGALFDACQSVYVLAGEKGQPTTVHHEKDRVRGSTLEDFGLSREDVPGPLGTRQGLRVVHLEAAQMVAAANVRDDAREDQNIERVAARIIETVGADGFYGSRTDLRARVRTKNETFSVAMSKLGQCGLLRRGGTYKEPFWTLVVPGSDPVPIRFSEPQDDPVPGSPPFREGTGSSSHRALDPVPDQKTLEQRPNLFRGES